MESQSIIHIANAARSSLGVLLALGFCGGCSPAFEPAGRQNSALVLDYDPDAGGAGWHTGEVDGTTRVAWGDYDRDGLLDLALGNGGRLPSMGPMTTGQQSRLYRNEGSDFSLSWSSLDEFNLQAMAWADVDDDGDLDLIAGSAGIAPPPPAWEPEGGGLHLFENLDGVFGSRSVIPLPGGDLEVRDLDVADLDGDGFIDVLLATEGGCLLVQGSDLGWEEATSLADWIPSPVRAVELTDIDGDGLPEATVAAGAQLFVLDNVDGELQPDPWWISSTDIVASDLIWGDLDLDGELDLVVTTTAGTLPLRRTRSGLEVGPALLGADPPNALDLSDVDLDGDLDLAVATSAGRIELWTNMLHNSTRHQIEPYPAWSDGPTWADQEGLVADLEFGDWNGDGDEDLAVAQGRADELPIESDAAAFANRLFENRASGLEVMELKYTTGERIQGSEAAVIELDGRAALVVAERILGAAPGTALRAYFVEPDGLDWLSARDLFSMDTDDYPPPADDPSAQPSVTALATADFDGDGDLDIALGTSVGLLLLERRGDEFVQVGRYDGADSIAAVSWADVDGDGDLDLASAGGEGPQGAPDGQDSFAPLRVWSNEGGQLEELWSAPTSASPAVSLAWGDYDSDGDMDLAAGFAAGRAADSITGHARVWRNPGDGRLEQAWSDPAPGQTVSVNWGDVTGDGQLELAVTPSLGLIRVWRLAGDQPTVVWTAPLQESGGKTQFTDWDGDGDLDISSIQGQRFRLYEADGQGGFLRRWSLEEDYQGAAIAPTLTPTWLDAEGDGDLDLLLSLDRSHVLLRNQRSQPARIRAHNPASIVFDRVGPGERGAGIHMGRPVTVEAGPIEVQFTVFDADSDPVPYPTFVWSSSGARWSPATVASPPVLLETAPHDEGGVTYATTWDWVADGADSETVQLRAIIPHQAGRFGEQRRGPVATVSRPLRVLLDEDGDGLRRSVDPCPGDPTNDSLVPGICDAETLTTGWWCAMSGSRAGPVGTACFSLFLLAAIRRRRPRSVRCS
ncbi:MAG: VCBS repeat-containing protein [Deltaproteobacteria bacterium]|nr:VCBS repeat-containing protein [Deltaproteobacteria bacterium]